MSIEIWPGSGPPVHGSPPHALPAGPLRRFHTGELVMDTDGVVWKCTASGRPGTWEEKAAPSGASRHSVLMAVGG